MANMNDDKDLMMLDDFFKEATELEIDDNGFTDKVMEVLPSTECKKAENRAFAKAELRWNIICATLAAVLFVALGTLEHENSTRFVARCLSRFS